MNIKTINFITGNSNKLKEFNQIIGEITNYKFQTQKLIDLPEYLYKKINKTKRNSLKK